MREIKFRGKRLSDGAWVEGDLSRCVVVGETHIRRIEDNLSTTTHRIDSCTICQYTGLNDKNGKEIYEGDIVECVYNGEVNIRVVVWDNDELDFKGTNGREKYGRNFDYLPCCDELVVIGNIFDNPELLKGDDAE